MRRRTILAATPDFMVAGVVCSEPVGRRWSAAEPMRRYGLVIARHGAFVRRVRGREAVIDPTVAYLERPGVEDEFAHPVAGGDACVSIALTEGLMAALAGGDPDLGRETVPVGAAAGLTVRRLVAAAAGGDPEGAAAELLVELIAGLVAAHDPRRALGGRPGTAAARRRLVDDARLALHEDPTAGLIRLARAVGSSPHHLSRLFRAATGLPVSAYRGRLRLLRALDRIAAGETDLAALATELGFADHSHLTRTMRAHTGATPSRLRRELAAPPDRSGTAG